MRPLLSTHCRNSSSTHRFRGVSFMALVIFGARISGFARGTSPRAMSRKQSTQQNLAYRRESY